MITEILPLPLILWSSQLEASARKLEIAVHTSNSLSARMPAKMSISPPTTAQYSCGGLRTTSGVSSHLTPFFDGVSLIVHHCIRHIISPASFQQLSCLYFPSPVQHRGMAERCTTASSFSHGFWDPNSGHQACCSKCFSHGTTFPASETKPCSVAQTDLKLPMQLRLAWNSQWFSSLCFWNAEIIGTHHHVLFFPFHIL